LIDLDTFASIGSNAKPRRYRYPKNRDREEAEVEEGQGNGRMKKLERALGAAYGGWNEVNAETDADLVCVCAKQRGPFLLNE